MKLNVLHADSLAIVYLEALYNQVPQIMRNCGFESSWIKRPGDVHLQFTLGITESQWRVSMKHLIYQHS
jgi:hypothetical protein